MVVELSTPLVSFGGSAVAGFFMGWALRKILKILLLVIVILNGLGNKESPGWARGFSIGAGALAIAISFLVIASPYAGAVFVSVFLGIALLIIGIEIIAVGSTGRRMQLTPTGGKKVNFNILQHVQH